MHRWLCLFVCVSVLGCSSASLTHTSNPEGLYTRDPPERQLRLVVLVSDGRQRADIKKLVGEASASLAKQAGITLVIIDWRSIEWKSRSGIAMLNQVASAMRPYPRQYDIAVAFEAFNAPELMQYVLIGNWEGIIDDTYRRFIVIRRMTAQVLLHELCHAFLFSNTHTWGLRHLMNPVTLYVLPGIMPVNRSSQLSEKDRAEIIRNRWRDFSARPSLGRSAQNNDVISP